MGNVGFSALISLLFVTFFVAGFFLGRIPQGNEELTLGMSATPVPTPLAKYEIDNLSKTVFDKGEIIIKDELESEDKFKSYLFEHKFRPDLDGEEKILTGVLNVPTEDKEYPLVLLLRGYVDQKIYSPGMGSRSAGIFFAQNGFITLSPDFLGYAGSSIESSDIFEARFQTYTTVLSLLASLRSINAWDRKNVLIWAHSNGGHVALTLLAITERDYPTVLWAPVTKPFPYSVLYYTDESVDEGKFIRNELGGFEKLYNVDKFSFTNYLTKIRAPIMVQQGGADDAVPKEWSDAFVSKLQGLNLDVEYRVYQSGDHNLRFNWDEAIQADLEFFVDKLK